MQLRLHVCEEKSDPLSYVHALIRSVNGQAVDGMAQNVSQCGLAAEQWSFERVILLLHATPGIWEAGHASSGMAFMRKCSCGLVVISSPSRLMARPSSGQAQCLDPLHNQECYPDDYHYRSP